MGEANVPAYGLASREDWARLSGRDLLQAVIDGKLPHPPISRALSFWIVEVGEGFAAFEGDAGPNLLNPAGGVHGGWALTMIDSATGCAAQTLLPAGTGYTTIETKGNFVRPITKDSGRVRCEARVVSPGRQVMTAEARVTGPDGKILAHGTSTLLVFGTAR